jgi:4-hydroxy-tetrahydrodipicolinate synthase
VQGEPVFRGVAAALVTLFRPDGELDAPATADLAARLAELGLKAVLVAGTTGEAASLDRHERQELLTAVRQALPAGRGVKVIMGTGAASARQAVLLTEAARDGGADAVLALSAPQTADQRPYYEAIVKAAGRVPVLAYHLPAVSPPGIPVNSLGALPVAGLKDSSGDAGRLLRELASWDQPIYVGAYYLATMSGLVGCAGMILALANAEPEACIAAFAGDPGAQLRLVEAQLVAERSFPAGVKELVARRFGCSATTRMG